MSASTLTWLGDLNANWSGGTPAIDTNWGSNALPTAGDTLVFDLTTSGVANLASTNDLTGLSLGGPTAISFVNDTVGGAGFTLSGNAITLGGNITSTGTSGTRTHTIALDLNLSGTRTVTAVTGTNITISGAIGETGGTFGLVKAGADAVTLTGSNSFTGPLSINQGILSVNSIADSGFSSGLGAGSVINFGNAAQTGTLTFTGPGGSTNRAINLGSAGAGSGVINSSGSGPLVITGPFTNAGTGSKTFTLGGTFVGANEVQSDIGNGAGGGTLAVTKTNPGSWTLTGNNSFTGPLSVNQGTLTISSLADAGINSAAGAGSQISFGNGGQTGTLVYAGAGASTNRGINLASAAAGGGTINSSGSGPLVITGSFTNAGTGAKTLTLGGSFVGGNEFQSSISNGAGGGTLSVVKANAGTWTLSGSNSFTGSLSINQGTLTLTSLADSGVNSAAGAGTQINLGAGAQTGAITFVGAGASTNRTIHLASVGAGGGAINSSGTGPLVVRGPISNAGTGTKTLTLGGSFSGANEVQSIIGNGTGGGALALTKANGGSWILSASNTFTGLTTVNAGTLVLTSPSAIAASAGLTINAGTVDVSGQAVVVSGPLTFGASSTTVGGQLASLVSSAPGGSFSPGGNITYQSGASGFENGQATIGVGLVLTADRTLAVNDSPNAPVDLLVSGVIGGGFGLTKSGPGTLRLNGENSFTGAALLNAGTTQISTLANVGAASALGTGDKDAAAVIIRLGNAATTATLEYVGAAASTNRRIQIGSGTGATASGGATILSNGTGPLVFTAPNFNSAANAGATASTIARVLTLGGHNAGANAILGAIIDNIGAGTSGTNAVAVAKRGSGTWELAGVSTYTGSTTVEAGTLLASGSLNGTAKVEVTGGTLLLGGSDRIQNSAELVLAGGTFATSGHSEGNITAPGLGTLTLNASSTIDFGAGLGSLLHFGSLGTRSDGAILSITNFQGFGNAGDDRLIFSGNPTDFTSVFSQSDVFFDGIPGYSAVSFESGRFEIIPVPEPTSGTLLVTGALFGLIGFREGRRRRGRGGAGKGV